MARLAPPAPSRRSRCSAAVSSASSVLPRLASSSSANASSARCSASTSVARASLMRRSAGPRAASSASDFTCAGDSPASSRIAIAEHVADPAGHERDEPRQRLALRAQLEEGARRRWRGRAPTIASTSPQTWRSADSAAARLDLLDADRRALRRARARASRARAAAAAGGRRPARRAPAPPRPRAHARAGRPRRRPSAAAPRLERRLGGDVAAGGLDRRHELGRAPWRGLPRARRTRPSCLGGHAGQRRRQRRLDSRRPSSARRRRR